MNYDQLVVLCTDKPVLYHVLMCDVEFMLSIDLEIPLICYVMRYVKW